MADSTTMTIRISEDLKSKLDRIAVNTRRSKSFIAAEALQNYADRELQIIEGIERGLADSKAGRTVSHDEAMRRIRSKIAVAKAAKTTAAE